jgi:hypothetical protein
MGGVKITIFRDGVSIENRSLPALDPASVKLDDRSIRDMLDSTVSLSKQVAYYSIANYVDGDWLPFFDLTGSGGQDKYLEYILDLPDQDYNKITARNITPHMALFLTFLALSEKLRAGINEIPGRHFDFFINDILRFERRAGIPDKAIIVLELTNNALPFKLEKGTPFLGGKGFDQQDIFYETEREIVVNHAKIADWRTSFRTLAEFSTIYVTAAAEILKELKAKAVSEEKGWMAFADGRLKDVGLMTVPAQTGWAIESPGLYMQEGNRSVLVELVIAWQSTTIPAPVINKAIPIEAYITTAKGWIKIEVIASEYRVATTTILANVRIPAHLPPVISGKDLLENMNIKWPVIKFILNPDNTSSLYDFLQFMAVREIKLTVTVEGIRNVVLQTAAGPASAATSFLPFGTKPAKGSKLYIGVNELRYKNIEQTNIIYKWKGAPANFGDYYKEYFSNGGVRPAPNEIPINNFSYKGKIEKLRDGKWETIDNIDLFPGNPSSDETAWDGFQFVPASQTERDGGITDIVALNNFPFSGYWAITFDLLTYNSAFTGPIAFGHDEYPKVLSEIATGKVSDPFTYGAVNLPNQPYTPEIEYLTVSYRSFETFQTFSNNPDNRFFHVAPFGLYEPDSTNNQVIPLHSQEGFLYMGIEQLTPPQNLTILFQVKEKGSDAQINPDYFSWSYLAGNRWVNLNKQQVVIDQTFGLKTSGVVELSIPSDATSSHTLMPAGKHWIRLGVLQDAQKANPLIDLQTQAVTAVYTGIPGNKNLVSPPGTITALIGNNGQVKSVKQPFQSYGGQLTEAVSMMRLRTQERLRHRDRAVNYWDYERLILDKFSELYKTKTLQCIDKNKKNAPGHVTVVAVPDQRGNNILEPKCSQLLLDKIEQFMQSKALPGITMHAVNPAYETVYFDFYVSFLPGLDPGYYQQQLNRELMAYISPWAFDNKEAIYFGSVFFKADIIKFIESRNYVDFITRFEMYSTGGETALFGIDEMKIADPADPGELDDFIIEEDSYPGIGDMIIGDNFIVGSPVNVAVCSSPSGILVSARNHSVRIIEAGKNACSAGLSGIGIGVMAVEIDFIVT